ncbi:MAG: response regulator transcription factor [Chitinophagaceae bacterium]|nr:response regulator transcription factor [Chitinophagaceae bacterium]
MSSTSIYLADDHTVVRKGLKELIECLGDHRITAEFSSGKELVDAMPFSPPPDMIILDIAMPVMDGKQVMEYFKEHDITLPVLILTLDTTEESIIELFRLGVRGYLPKNCSPDELQQAIEDIVHTGYYHNELLVKALSMNKQTSHGERDMILSQLTKRELEFLQLVCDEQEYTYEQIGDKLGVHVRTVDGYRKSLFEKFNIKSKTGVVLFAFKYRLVDGLTA